MAKNLGNADRVLRVLGAVGLGSCAVFSPFPLALRLGAFATTGVYLLLTALGGTCLGYKLMGRSTCPAERSA